MRTNSTPRRADSHGARPGVVFDAPTATEWAIWWRIPRLARVYNATIVGAGVAIAVGARSLGGAGAATLAAFAVLLVAGLATVELGRLAEGGRVQRQRIHKGLSAWPFATALVIGAGPAAVVAAAVYAHALLRGISITRWKWIGSWGIVSLSCLAASTVLRLTAGHALPGAGSVRVAAGVGAALLAFLAVEASSLFVISRLNSAEDEVYLRAQLAGAAFYLVEASVLASGAAAAVLYRYSPALVLLAVPAFFLMQQGMLHQPLRDEARHDFKTGVLNWEAWRAAAEVALCQVRRSRTRAAVVIVDVDRFKAVNDTYGHLLGDEVLAGAADAVVGCLRSTDIAGRFGGDEFCALLVCDTLGEAAAAAERIRDRVARLRFDDPSLTVTASVGVALTGPGQAGIDLDALVASADQALYEAKEAGRDRVSARVARCGSR